MFPAASMFPKQFESQMIGNSSAAPWYHTGLLHYWRFEEVSGTRYDSFGTLHLAPSASDPGYTTGIQGNAVDFEQDNSQTLTSTTVIDFTGDWTIAFWAKPESSPAPGSYHIVNYIGGGFGNGGGPQIKQAFNDEMAFVYYKGDNNDTVVIHAVLKATGNWTFLVFTHDSVGKNCDAYSYYTGVRSVETISHSAWTPVATVRTFHISTAGNSLSFDGSIDEYGMWNRVLLTSEMDLLYNGGAGIAYQ